jgi:autotransporter passenger strand-loop-strand repeat protein
MEYHDLILSGKNVEQIVGSGDSAFNTLVRNSATLCISSGGYVQSTTVMNDTRISNGGVADVTFLSGGTMFLAGGGVASDVRLLRNAKLNVASGGTALGVSVATSGNVNATVIGGDRVTRIEGVNSLGGFCLSNGIASNFVLHSTGMLEVWSGGTALGTVIRSNGSLTVSGGGVATGIVMDVGGKLTTYIRGGDSETVICGSHVSGTFSLSGGVASNFMIYEIAAMYVSSGGTALHTLISSTWGHQYVSSGGVADATSIFSQGSMTVYGGGVARNTMIYSGGSMIAAGGGVSGATVRGLLRIDSTTAGADETGAADATVCGISVESGGSVQLSAKATISGLVVHSGGRVQFSNTAANRGSVLEDTTLEAGARLDLLATTDAGPLLTLDFTGTTGDQSITISNLGLVSDTTAIVLKGETAGNTYTIATTGATDKYVNCDGWGLYGDRIKAGESITDAFTGLTYGFNAAGTAITVGKIAIAEQTTAGTIEEGTELAGGGRAAKWTSSTGVTPGAIINVANGSIAGDAWLEIDGTDLAGTTLYGATGNFGNAVNLFATSGAVLGNLAAGAAAGGTVSAVRFTVDSATLGVAYAGGFGNVTDKTETLIGSGAKVVKDFYAGALANYAKTGLVTSGGDVALEIAGGTFSGNIYGAASVKAGGATTLVHNVGDVKINVKDGSTTKGGQACLFAGGYATGSEASETAVYTVGSVTAEIAGGSWGSAKGGCGVYGGVMASGATARAGDVNLTVSGGNMGNVYGGGWAQKGGTSAVGDVNITITGDAEVANVFGGGSHSTSGGTTTAGNVTITVSGGTIANAIYARGHLGGDTVESARVIFSGAHDHACDIYGYSAVGGTTDSDATLVFTDCTGTFSGSIGGFGSITLGGGTAMTLAPGEGESVSNTAWSFDVSARDAALADTALLNWSDSFAGRNVKLTVGAKNTSPWTLVSGVGTYRADGFAVEIAGGGTYDLEFDAASGRTGTLGGAGCSGTLASWGFALEDTVLKFKNLA